MEEFVTRIRMDPTAAVQCVAIGALKRSRPKSRNVATVNSTGVATLSAKLARKMSNLLCVNNQFLLIPPSPINFQCFIVSNL